MAQSNPYESSQSPSGKVSQSSVPMSAGGLKFRLCVMMFLDSVGVPGFRLVLVIFGETGFGFSKDPNIFSANPEVFLDHYTLITIGFSHRSNVFPCLRLTSLSICSLPPKNILPAVGLLAAWRC